jgi:alpha-galactosidase
MREVTIRLGDTQVVARADGEARAVHGGVLLPGADVRVDFPGTPARFYRHGWQSWSQTRWLAVDEPVAPVTAVDLRALDDDPAHALAGRQGGAVVGALRDDTGAVLLVGAAGMGGRVELDGDGLEASSDVVDEWFVAFGGEQQVFDAYADLLGSRVGRRTLPELRVWCSWYSFYRDITEPALDRVLADLDGLAFDVFQVDDGWQRHIGDWQVNDDFPSGMPALAGRIRDAGLRPGLWLAPFLAHEASQLCADHPEWVLRDADGDPVPAGWNWGGRVHALDVTHPDALAHVVEVLCAAVGWGFDYLKLDFIYAGALEGRRHVDTERHTAYRRAVEAIRDGVGDDVLLLACGAPVVPSLGVFDAIRIGPDVAEIWENTEVTRYLHHLGAPQARYAVATSVHRLWLQPLIGTDPDVAYFRTRYCLLTDEQKALVADLTRVCRFRATSDVPATLDPHERDALARYLEETSTIERVGRHRYAIDGREVDFGPVADEAPVMLPISDGR